MLTGFIVGAIQMFYGYYVHPVQIFLDYALAYTVVGLQGFLAFHKLQVVQNVWLLSLFNLLDLFFVLLPILFQGSSGLAFMHQRDGI
ncbi:energy-coupled thiamine transporter ThiT [Anaerobacillus sp. HL2]|nr:energy-coupled thiamine transporter ThiT [Anaerobacillus sp. HL2]